MTETRGDDEDAELAADLRALAPGLERLKPDVPGVSAAAGRRLGAREATMRVAPQFVIRPGAGSGSSAIKPVRRTIGWRR
ncbi:MAG: hypothetical protein AVDCRST_MAG04-2845 [uncultured Acetobacteraceae bacterium]|uniref:Uncharacterized protein n=1 Tax=uncultured Acetobacteraceae bacterium TaxID=169975 RepID=A0A6J4IYW5_9PROT|nr:MAG: hypothetical protein AVDCRST_MAG04-2845 [uncultured Acetobacteraceae bacterium]